MVGLGCNSISGLYLSIKNSFGFDDRYFRTVISENVANVLAYFFANLLLLMENMMHTLIRTVKNTPKKL